MSQRLLCINRDNSTIANKIISAPDDVSPEWLSFILQRNSGETRSRVRSVEVLLREELPISTICRLGITYEEPVSEGCPRSIFLKLPRVLSKVGKTLGVDDHAEVEFYTNVASRIGSPPLIRCYDAAYSRKTHLSHILLEDLTETHSQPEQNNAPPIDLSRDAVRALARAHGACWRPQISDSRSDSLIFEESGRSFDKKTLGMFIENLTKNVAEFQKFADLTADQNEAYRLMLGSADAIWGRMMRKDHLTITHGDMHWWNFLYPKEPHLDSVRVFDWHLWHRDLGTRDLAFLLALGGFAEPRPEIEEDLLRAYYETLVENGVIAYSWDMLIEDYRWSAIRNLNIPVIFWSQGKHYSTWRTAMRRAFDSYNRLECRSLIVGR